MMKFLLLVLLYCSIISAAKDYYEILGLTKSADERDVKSAFRQLSKKFHPDKNPTSEANEKFMEINEAYEVLSDPEKKSNFDKFGDPEGPGDHGGVDFGDIFSHFFGGGPGGHQRGPPRGDDTQANLHLGLYEFYNGKEFTFDVEMQNICGHCKGTGSEDQQTHTCPKCGGRGMIQIRRQLGPGMIQTFNMQCDQCGGSGNLISKKCKVCHGEGSHPADRHYTIFIPPGFTRDDSHIIPGEGDQIPGMEPGDLIITIREDFKDSWGYRRVNDNLYRTEVLTAKEAINGGWERRIPFLDKDDGELILKRKSGVVTIDGEIQQIKHKGMPSSRHDGDFGDLFIEYKVVYASSDNGSVKDEL